MTGWLRTVGARVWAALRRQRFDREFDEELTTHFELLVDDYRRGGLSAADARREASRALGPALILREDNRAQRGLPLVDVLLQDLRLAIRLLWKARGFTVVVVASLALGIGANTALFSLVDRLLLRTLPVHEPGRLVRVQHTLSALGIRKVNVLFSTPTFDYIRAHNDVLAAVIGVTLLERPLVTVDGAVESGRQVERVSTNFFHDLGVTPVLGRGPETSDGAVALLSHGLWRSRFGGDPKVLGRSLSVDGQPYTIVGVAPPRFQGLSVDRVTDLWVASDTPTSLQMLARLKPGRTAIEAQALLQVLFGQLSQAQPDTVAWDGQMQVELLPAGTGLSNVRTRYERPLLALMLLVTLVFLITCTNVGNLLVVRNRARTRELAVRVAIGASRGRLLVQHVVESGVLAVLGGMAALPVAWWGTSILVSMLPVPVAPDGLAFQVDARIVSFVAGLSLLGLVLFGLLPAWRHTRIDLANELRPSVGSTASRRTRYLGRSLVACQVGLSVLLLVGAGLFVQTLRNLARLDVGFEPEQLLQVSLDSFGSGYRQGQVGPLSRVLVDRLSAVPGVQSVAGVRSPVMQGALSRTRFRSLGPNRPLGPGDEWDSIEVGQSFFETMKIPLVSGRTFSAADFSSGPTVVLVNQAFVRRFFPDEDPTRGPTASLIVGVVRDAQLTTMRYQSRPLMYFPARPGEMNRLDALVVRIAGDPDTIARAIQQQIQEVSPRLLVGIRSMHDEIARSIATERMIASISGFFSLLGLLLVSIGIFGVASYTVAQRTTELGIKIALGAQPWSVIRESLHETLLIVVVGVVAGIIVSVAAVRASARFVSELLFGLTAADIPNMFAAVLLMLLVAAVACLVPARRATRIDPLAAIRHE